MPVNLKKSRLTFSEYQRELRREARNERIKEAAAYIAMAALFVAVFVAGSVVANLVTRSHDVIYYGTHTRAVELLVGALLAFALPIGRDVSTKVAHGLAAVGAASLLVFGLFIAAVSTTRVTMVVRTS